MSDNEPETRQEKEPEAGTPSTACCSPCTPGREGAFKRFAEKHAEAVEGQPTPAPSNTGGASRCSCGC